MGRNGLFDAGQILRREGEIGGGQGFGQAVNSEAISANTSIFALCRVENA